MSELERIEAKLAGITPGHWEYDVGSGSIFNDHEDPDLVAYVENSLDGGFIRSAPETVRYLLALARQQGAALEAVQALADEWARGLDNPDHLIYLEDALEATRSALGQS